MKARNIENLSMIFRTTAAFVLFQLLLFGILWLLYLQYPTMQLKAKLFPAVSRPQTVTTTPTSKRAVPPPATLSPQKLIAVAGLPIAAAPGFARNYTLELSELLPKQAAKQQVKSLAHQGIKAYYLPSERNGKDGYLIRSGVYAGKPLAQIKSVMIRNKAGLNFAIVELP